MRSLLAVCGCVAAALLFAPAVAGAYTFCVGATPPPCDFTYPATGDDLSKALSDADTKVDFAHPTPAIVTIGPGTYLRSDGAGFQTNSDNVTIQGAGQSTVLTTDSDKGRDGLISYVDTATVRNLRVDVPGNSYGIEHFKSVSDVRVSGHGPVEWAITLAPGGRLTRATIDPAAVGTGVVATSGVIEDVAVRLHGSGRGVEVGNDTAPTIATTIRHLTVLGDGSHGSWGVGVVASGSSSQARELDVSVRDTVLRTLEHPLFRSGTTSDPSHPGTANIDYRYSSLDTTKLFSEGPGGFSAGTGNLADPDPLLGPDLHPLAGSPLIDAGDPAGPDPGDSPTDAAGSPRIAGARRDIGAFEFQPGPAGPGPPITISPGPVAAAARNMSLSPRSFAAASNGASAASRKRRKTGTTVTYTLNVAAPVRFTVQQTRPGRRAGKGKKARCVAPSRRNVGARRCRRLVTLRGSFTRAGTAGTNRFHFTGRLAGKRLPLGAYTLVATPHTGATAGLRARTRFRIVK
jgi:hypothetical protein